MKTTHLLTILFIMLITTSCHAQGKQTIKGTIKDAKQVYVTQFMGKVDSTAVTNGTFTYEIEPSATGDIYTVSNSLEREGAVNRIYFVADGSEVSIDMDTRTINGTGINAIINTYNKEAEQIEAEYEAAYMQLQAAGETDSPALKEKINAMYEKYMNHMVETYEKNADNMFGAYLLSTQLAYGMDANELEVALKKLEHLGDHKILMQPKQLLANYAKRRVGNKFIDFEMADANGNMHKLSEWCGQGKYVLIDFWASWCGPCCKEMPNVVANYKKYHDKGFEIIGVSFDRSKEAWLKKVEDLGLNWIHLSDLKFWQCIASDLYGIRSIPANTLVGPDGTIVANDLREEALGAKLKEIYGE